jgi:hypothetical protein
VQYDLAVRNAKLNAIRDAVGPGAVMRIWTGALPADCSSADRGRLLASIDLPHPWLDAADDAVIEKSGEWRDWHADAPGKPGHFRIYSADGICRLQGALGKDMKLNTDELFAGQMFTVTQFRIRDNNG